MATIMVTGNWCLVSGILEPCCLGVVMHMIMRRRFNSERLMR